MRLATKEFKLSNKKINMLRVKAFAEMGQMPALKEFVLTLNKKSETLPWDAIFDYLDSRNRYQVNHS